MRSRRRWTRPAAAVAALVLVLILPLLAGCGGSGQQDPLTAVTETSTAFLNALGEQDVEVLRSFMSQSYLGASEIPDPITVDSLVAALGYVNSYSFIPEEDVAVEGGRALVTMDLELAGQGVSEQTLVLTLEDEAWKVDAFTAMDWSSKPVEKREGEEVEVEQALRDFLVACVDGDTSYIFEHLSKDYKERHHLEVPWTSAEFSGIFGTARSFDFNAEEIEIDDDRSDIDVTVEFGTRGNLESETTRVGLVLEDGDWLIDTFPFFIY